MRVWIVWEKEEDDRSPFAAPVPQEVFCDYTQAKKAAVDGRYAARKIPLQYAVRGIDIEPPKRGWR